MKPTFLFLVLCCFLVDIFANRNHTPTVCLDGRSCALGKYMWSYETYIYEAFLGIPYAKPPIGDLRFKNPVKADLWTGPLLAQYPRHECIQKNFNNYFSGSEDCLYLNIYRPLHRKAYNLPVIFYIHGGGFHSGSASPLVEGPEYFMETSDVILVVPAYRLGLFGFLSTGDEQMPGNFGFKDQNLALKWVQEYISAFGGDPTRVTIFGNSAGAVSAHFHMLSPLSNGLFQNAILMSGTATTPYAQPLANPKEQVIQLANAVGIENASEISSDHLVKALQQIDPIQLLKFNNGLKSKVGYPLILFRPSIEDSNSGDSFLTKETFTSLAENPNSASVPWIIGNVPSKGEGLVVAARLASDFRLQKEFNANFDEMLMALLNLPARVATSADVISRLVSKYMGGVYEINDYTMEGFLELLGDAYFIYPTYKTIKTSLGAGDAPQACPTGTTEAPVTNAPTTPTIMGRSRFSRDNSDSDSDDYSESDSDYTSDSDSDDYSDSDYDDSSDSDSDDYSDSDYDDSSDSDSDDYSDSDSDNYSDSDYDDSSDSDSDDYSDSSSSEEKNVPNTTPTSSTESPVTNDPETTPTISTEETESPETITPEATPSTSSTETPEINTDQTTPISSTESLATNEPETTPTSSTEASVTDTPQATPSSQPGAPGASVPEKRTPRTIKTSLGTGKKEKDSDDSSKSDSDNYSASDLDDSDDSSDSNADVSSDSDSDDYSESDSNDLSDSDADASSDGDSDDSSDSNADVSSDSDADVSSDGDSDDNSETDSDDSSLERKRSYVSENINDNITNLVGIIKFNYRGPYSYSKIYSGSLRNFGTVHSDDALFLFKSPITFPFGYFSRSPEAALIKRYVGLYVEFAKTGKVKEFENIDTCTKESFEKGKCEYLSIVKRTEPLFQVDNNWEIERMRLWDDIYCNA